MKPINSIAIVANGRVYNQILPSVKNADYIIGVDKATWWLIDHTCVPQCALGDFDSVSEKQWSVIQKNCKDIQTFNKEKNETDLELALQYAYTLRPKEIRIFGAIGTRLDHSLAAIQLLEQSLQFHASVYIEDEHNRLTITKTRVVINKDKRFTYFSLIPITDKANCSISGSTYPLRKHSLIRGTSRGISNQICGKQAVITVHSGKILVIQSTD
jgi:thiamine pyrophosphokinase